MLNDQAKNGKNQDFGWGGGCGRWVRGAGEGIRGMRHIIFYTSPMYRLRNRKLIRADATTTHSGEAWYDRENEAVKHTVCVGYHDEGSYIDVIFPCHTHGSLHRQC
jgi:hypothetical protein